MLGGWAGYMDTNYILHYPVLDYTLLYCTKNLQHKSQSCFIVGLKVKPPVHFNHLISK